MRMQDRDRAAAMGTRWSQSTLGSHDFSLEWKLDSGYGPLSGAIFFLFFPPYAYILETMLLLSAVSLLSRLSGVSATGRIKKRSLC